jgi:drug/metabolite transporter (DMT)-like permease
VVYLLATCAALSSAVAGVLQRMGIESAPASDAMRLRLLTRALRRGVWLAGFGLLLVAFGLQATALRFGDLSVVQPLLTTDLLFTVLILAIFFHRPLGWRELGGAGAVVVGLGGFLAIASPAVGRGLPGARGWGGVTVAVFCASAILVAAAQRGPRWARAASFGGAAAVLFAYNASLTKATTTLVTQGWGHVFTHWEPYALAATGLFGFFLMQNALHAGPLAASRAVMVIVNPLVSIVIGVFVFDEHLRTGVGYVAAEVLALLVMCAGALALTLSPLVAGADKPGGAGEMLRPVAEPVAPGVPADD